ncbi:hypothetical protein QYE76_025508 [Lolium multiflorum]|uniref:CCHC-type domain-containing protein n=1 Tax=Lolium multiflorum TaxID=4521 RepID=A0AAD8RFY0_LOLMU|nr:hypothetical protein QYE76_025508 [Lolium multiflorum]
MATAASCATTTMAPSSSHAYGLRCYKCKKQGHRPRECPNLLCEVCKAKGHEAWQCTKPSAKTLYFDELQAQATKKPLTPTLQDEDRQGELKGEVEPSLALNNTMAPPIEDDLGGNGVEMVEHVNFPSTKEAHGDEKVEPTPICLIDDLVPIPRSKEDEFPIMETMYMVHEDDDISPCLLQDGHVDHMDPTTSTTPTSNESADKGADIDKDQERRNSHGARKRRRKEEKKEEEEEAGGRGPAGPEAGQPGPRPARPVPGPVNRSPNRISSVLTGVVPSATFPVGDRSTVPTTGPPGHRPGLTAPGPDPTGMPHQTA